MNNPKRSERYIRRAWTPTQLNEIWEFCQHDFARFLKMLVWLDKLK